MISEALPRIKVGRCFSNETIVCNRDAGQEAGDGALLWLDSLLLVQ